MSFQFQPDIKAVLLDIEGTTSSISFVHDVMFPYAKEHLASFLEENWDSEMLDEILEILASDLGYQEDGSSSEAGSSKKGRAGQWLADCPNKDSAQAKVHKDVTKLIDNDVKATGLKKLQGLIWKSGFHSGKLVSHLWPEVHQTLTSWKEKGLDLRIYSSGSVQAQKLFFGHTEHGDLLNLFSGHYDTEIGGKKEKDSYLKIISQWNLPAGQILFISDSIDELDAAAGAGINVALSIRPGNQKIEREHSYQTVERFDELELI